MTALAGLASLPQLHALGWTLLHFCWQGAAVAAMLGLALAILPRRSAALRYAAACAALALMSLLPLATFARLVLTSAPAGQQAALPGGAIAGAVAGSASAHAPAWPERFQDLCNAALPEVIAFWLAGVLLLLVRLNLALLAARRMRARAQDSVPAQLHASLRALSARLGLRRAVRLLHSTHVQAPTVLGWLRPAILLPAGCFLGMSVDQIEAVLAHELAHIRRHDYLVGVLQSVVETAFFYHPGVWWVSRQMRREREACCDDAAVRLSGDHLAYAQALVILEARRGPAMAGALSATGGDLKMRIKRLLSVEEPAVSARCGALALLALLLVGGGLAGVLRAQTAERSAGATAVSAQTAWSQWVSQDVRWIITPREKQAFLRLTTDAERREFVRQFWERRNPVPGSAVNEYKVAYDQRMAYANRRWSTNGRPGWASDPGHVYIVFGPPDTIDAHPARPAVPAWQTWHYRALRIQTAPGKSVLRSNVDFRFVQQGGVDRLTSPWPR